MEMPLSSVTMPISFRSGSSVVSFGTARSTLSKFSSVRSHHKNPAENALLVSQATAQAAQAAKAILNAGGSELTALKTAKAAAASALMPESTPQNEGLGTTFRRRRKLKRQAEIVASMALAAAMSQVTPAPGNDHMSVITTEEEDPLLGLKMIQDTTPRTETLTTKESSSCGNTSEERSTDHHHQGRLLAPSASGTSSLYAPSGSDLHSERSMRQSSKGQQQRPVQANQRKKTIRFLNVPSGSQSFSVDNMSSMESYSRDDDIDHHVLSCREDNVFSAIANAITCAPIWAALTRPRGAPVERREEDYYEETIRFDTTNSEDYGTGDERPSMHSMLDASDDEDEDEENFTDQEGDEDNHIVTEQKGMDSVQIVRPTASTSNTPRSIRSGTGGSFVSSNDEILLDLLTSTSMLSPRGVAKAPSTMEFVELQVPSATASGSPKANGREKAPKVRIVAASPLKRSDRLSLTGGVSPINRSGTDVSAKNGTPKRSEGRRVNERSMTPMSNDSTLVNRGGFKKAGTPKRSEGRRVNEKSMTPMSNNSTLVNRGGFKKASRKKKWYKLSSEKKQPQVEKQPLMGTTPGDTCEV